VATGLACVIALLLVVTARPVSADEPAPPAPTPAIEQPTVPPVDQPAEGGQLPLREGALGSRVHRVQVRLQWLGYSIPRSELDGQDMGASTVKAVVAFQQKVGLRESGIIDARTWARIGDTAGPVGRLPVACRGEKTICVDTSQRLVRLVVDDNVVLTLDARFGIDGDTTREGTFRVYWKSRDHTSSRYQTWMPFALFFAGGQAVHYSPYFARDGYDGGSHGCINLRDFDNARWLFDHVTVGTRVHVYG